MSDKKADPYLLVTSMITDKIQAFFFFFFRMILMCSDIWSLNRKYIGMNMNKIFCLSLNVCECVCVRACICVCMHTRMLYTPNS